MSALRSSTRLSFVALFLSASAAAACAAEPKTSDSRWPLVFTEDFEHGAGRWQAPDPAAFRIDELDGNHVLNQFRQAQVLTPVRSPFNRLVIRDVVVGSCQLDVRFRSTARNYPHRSLCLFFGYQDPAHLYYVHFGQKTDEHANNVFIVNDAPRLKISTETTPGTPWDNEWHQGRVIRDVESGMIEVYFDDMTKPVMKAVDKTFTWGRAGIGSFDDTGLFDDVQLYGEVVTPAFR